MNILVAGLWFILVIGLAISMLVAAIIYAFYRLFSLNTNYSIKMPNFRLAR